MTSEYKLHDPIIKKCPECGKETYWHWTDEINIPFMGIHHPKGSLACDGCGCVVDPLDLGVKPYGAWLEDPENYRIYTVKDGRMVF